MKEKLTPVPEPVQPYQVEKHLTSHESTPLSVGIKNYIDEKDSSVRQLSIVEMRSFIYSIIAFFL